jgi:hypothetical protein
LFILPHGDGEPIPEEGSGPVNGGFDGPEIDVQDLCDFLHFELFNGVEYKTVFHAFGQVGNSLIQGVAEFVVGGENFFLDLSGHLGTAFAEIIITGVDENPEDIGAEYGVLIVVADGSVYFEKSVLDSVFGFLLFVQYTDCGAQKGLVEAFVQLVISGEITPLTSEGNGFVIHFFFLFSG